MNSEAAVFEHGRQCYWNIGGSHVERRRRENRGAVGGERCAPSRKIYEFFISKWGSSTQDDTCRSNIGGVAISATPAALTPMFLSNFVEY